MADEAISAAVNVSPDNKTPTVPEPHAGVPGAGTPNAIKPGETRSEKRSRSMSRAAEEIAKMRGQALQTNKDTAAKSAKKTEVAGPLAAQPGITPNEAASGAVAKAAEEIAAPAAAETPKPKETTEDEKAAEARRAKEIEDKQFREIRRRKKQLRAERERFAEERAALIRERERIAAEKAADDQLKQNNRTAWLEKHGYDFRAIARDAVARETETPEQKAVREAREEARIAREQAEALKREVEADRAVRQTELAERRKSEAIRALETEARQSFKEYKTEYPTLAAHYTEDEIAAAVTQVRIDHFKRTGREASANAALAHIEGNAKRERDRFLRSQIGTGASEKNGAGGERATPSAKAEETRAAVRPVTNKDSATTAGASTPMTPRDRRARAAEVASRVMGGR